uniref:Reverse transcriptase domain-containing protein n=1 Tax=Panagrolaimus sp. ES5 TaxID=591445 RepID=A0AC34GW57_9BILA
MTPTPTTTSAVPVAGDATVATTTSIVFPHVPTFIHDPTKPNGAASWLKQIEMKFSLTANLTSAHKIAIVCSALDSDTFDRVARKLLPKDIAAYDDWNKFKTVFISLFDIKRSLFADRFSTLQIEWQGPDHESVQEYMARVRQSVTLFKCEDFTDNELSTLVVIMGMKAAALEPLRSLVLNALIKKPKEKLEDIETLLDNALMTERDQKLPEQHQINFVKKTVDRRPPHRKPAASQSASKPPSPCPACGGAHWKVDCSFKEAACHTCGEKGHISKVCKSGKKKDTHPSSKSYRNPAAGYRNPAGRSQKKVGYVQINTLAISKVAPPRHLVDASINGTQIKMQYDSGSDITILSRRDYQLIGAPALAPAVVRAATASNQPLMLDGYFRTSIACAYGSKCLDVHVGNVACSLLGLDFCSNIKLFIAQVSSSAAKAVEPASGNNRKAVASKSLASTVSSAAIQSSIACIQKEYASLFEPGLGRCTKRFIHLQLKPNAHPVRVNVRRMNQQAMEVAKAELDRLCNNGVMKAFEGGYAEWATPGSIVKRKDGRSRFVVDYSTGLNEQLEESSYQLPVPEDIYDRLNGCKYFTQLDLSDAYHQVPLDEESQKLTMVTTPFGYFKFLVAAMGLKTLPSDFQQIMDDMLHDMPFASAYLDDILIFSIDYEQHLRHVKAVLQRIQEWGFRLSLKKCKFFQTSIQFLGRLIDAEGIHPDPAKIAAIQSMAAPKD